MKITLEPTGSIRPINGHPAREWRGEDEHGVPVVAFIIALSPQTHDADVNARFARELKDLGHAEQAPIAFDLRKVL
ncbi:hypothetical protein EBR96_08900 [bacterium]|nr:hypothetical protein [bacterium]